MIGGGYTVTQTVAETEGLSNSTSQSVRLDTSCDGIACWSTTTSYAFGDAVAYNVIKYNSIWRSTGVRPDVFSNVWTANCVCKIV